MCREYLPDRAISSEPDPDFRPGFHASEADSAVSTGVCSVSNPLEGMAGVWKRPGSKAQAWGSFLNLGPTEKSSHRSPTWSHLPGMSPFLDVSHAGRVTLGVLTDENKTSEKAVSLDPQSPCLRQISTKVTTNSV